MDGGAGMQIKLGSMRVTVGETESEYDALVLCEELCEDFVKAVDQGKIAGCGLYAQTKVALRRLREVRRGDED